MSAKVPGKGHTAKHTSSKKHHAKTSKHHPAHHKKAVTSHGHGHHVHVVAKGAKHPVARGFAIGDLLPVCTFEAVAQSLRLAGQFVDDDEVAGLWELAGSPPLGTSLAGALDAAGLHGIAGFRPQFQRLSPVHAADHLALPVAEDEAVLVHPFEDLFADDFHGLILGGRTGVEPAAAAIPAPGRAFTHAVPSSGPLSTEVPASALILGIDTPGPHAVVATPDGWWSWGELYSPWPARIEEAWLIGWGDAA